MKITITGQGGQGIKFLGYTLASILAELNEKVSLTLSYDADVRGGDSTAFLVFSEKKIENPLFEEADILIKLSNKKTNLKTKKVINCDGTIAKIAIEKFGSQKFNNMIALGKILKALNLKIDEKLIIKQLPKNHLEQNLKAIKEGFNL